MAALPTSPQAPLFELHLKLRLPPIVRGRSLKIIRYKKLGSTNTKAKTLAEKGAADWTAIFSEVQTQGRGRSGRRWKSPKGGLWFSLIIRPKITVDRIALLQFWAANALRKGIEEVYRVRSKVKWPNDLVVDWQKLAGILIETKIRGPRLEYAVVGVGLNVNLTEKEVPFGASSIFLVRKKRFGLDRTMGSVLKTFEANYGTLQAEKVVVADWWKHCAHRMRSVVIDTEDKRINGKCVGLNTDGSIIIDTARGKVTVPDGTLRLDL